MAFDQLNHLIALGTVLMEVLAALLLVLFFWGKNTPLARMAERWALPLAFLITIAGIAISLVYSEYFGIVPCSLCWFQRVFLYPQAILFGIALWKKDARVAVYSIALSLFGGIIALYQHYLQMGGNDLVPCPSSGGDCVKRFLFEYGYITFPFVSLVTFALLIVLMLYVRRSSTGARP